MGYEIRWDSPQGVIRRHFGRVTGKDVLSANIEIEADPRFDNLRYVINDFLACTGVTVSPGEIEEIAAIDKAAALINPNIRIAMLATHPEVVSAANAYSNDPLNAHTTRVFCCMADAKAWLGLSLE